MTIDDELGPVRYCPQCAESWPDDDDFFAEDDVLCRACVTERRERRQASWREAQRRYRERNREMLNERARLRWPSRRATA